MRKISKCAYGCAMSIEKVIEQYTPSIQQWLKKVKGKKRSRIKKVKVKGREGRELAFL